MFESTFLELIWPWMLFSINTSPLLPRSGGGKPTMHEQPTARTKRPPTGNRMVRQERGHHCRHISARRCPLASVFTPLGLAYGVMTDTPGISLSRSHCRRLRANNSDRRPSTLDFDRAWQATFSSSLIITSREYVGTTLAMSPRILGTLPASGPREMVTR